MLMPPSSMHTSSPLLPHPWSPASYPCTPGSNSPEGQVDVGVWKWQYFVLQESVILPLLRHLPSPHFSFPTLFSSYCPIHTMDHLMLPSFSDPLITMWSFTSCTLVTLLSMPYLSLSYSSFITYWSALFPVYYWLVTFASSTIKAPVATCSPLAWLYPVNLVSESITSLPLRNTCLIITSFSNLILE